MNDGGRLTECGGEGGGVLGRAHPRPRGGGGARWGSQNIKDCI